MAKTARFPAPLRVETRDRQDAVANSPHGDADVHRRLTMNKTPSFMSSLSIVNGYGVNNSIRRAEKKIRAVFRTGRLRMALAARA